MAEYATIASSEALLKTVKSLEQNGFSVTVVGSLEEAKKQVLDFIPKGSEVFTATSVTLQKAGLVDILNDPEVYDPVRNKIDALSTDKTIERRRVGSASEFIVGSVHAITEQGEVLVASNSGSQLPGYVYGADSVIWVVGTQKLVKDLSDGLNRIEEHTLPLEDERAQKAYRSGSVLSKILIYRKDPPKRVRIILVEEAVGY